MFYFQDELYLVAMKKPITSYHNGSILWIVVLSMLASCQLSRFVVYNFADIRDYRKFHVRSLVAAEKPFRFIEPTMKKEPKEIDDMPLEGWMKETGTVALLVIKNDTLWMERYHRKYDQENIVPSFSMAKSVTSLLIGCAIADGYIQSVSDPVTKYIPELARNGFDVVTVEHLLQMTSGLDFNEGYYNPFGEAAAFYYGRNLWKKIGRLKLKRAPGLQFEYNSGNTQLLGAILDRALPETTITEYLQQKLWTPMGMEFDASWSLDKKRDGLEKTFCCLNARARDFAKIGRLMLHGGNWNGKQLVPSSWVAASTRADTALGGADFYKYQWWLYGNTGPFMAQGILGQFVYVNPSRNLVMVRLGKREGRVNWWSFFAALDGFY